MVIDALKNIYVHLKFWCFSTEKDCLSLKQSIHCTHRRDGDICVPVMQRNLFDSRVYSSVGLININHGLDQPQIT